MSERRQIGDRSLKNDVYAEIVALIHNGELRPGDRISEMDVAMRLGISRAPVREAFSQLVFEGLIVRKPRSGHHIARLSRKDMEDIRDTRIILESGAARRACLRITREDESLLTTLIDDMDRIARQHKWTEAATLNARFHQTVFRIANNQVLERLWRSLDPLAWLLAPAAEPQSVHIPEGLVVRHQALLDALLTGDPDCAADAFRNHVLTAAGLTAGLATDSRRPENDLPGWNAPPSSTANPMVDRKG